MSISYGRTKANSKENSFCVVNLKRKFILCYFAYAYVAGEDQALEFSKKNPRATSNFRSSASAYVVVFQFPVQQTEHHIVV